jgi:preprotein translocase subunit SecA
MSSKEILEELIEYEWSTFKYNSEKIKKGIRVKYYTQSNERSRIKIEAFTLYKNLMT